MSFVDKMSAYFGRTTRPSIALLCFMFINIYEYYQFIKRFDGTGINQIVPINWQHWWVQTNIVYIEIPERLRVVERISQSSMKRQTIQYVFNKKTAVSSPLILKSMSGRFSCGMVVFFELLYINWTFFFRVEISRTFCFV
jgi:hypothetical protein